MAKVWDGKTIGELCDELNKRELISVNHRCTVKEAADLMRRENILSLAIRTSPPLPGAPHYSVLLCASDGLLTLSLWAIV